jgi:O-antigen ligase
MNRVLFSPTNKAGNLSFSLNSFILALIFITLLFFSSLAASHPPLPRFGRLAIVCVLAIGNGALFAYLATAKTLNRTLIPVTLSFSILLCIYSFSYIINPVHEQGITNTLQILLIFGYFHGFSLTLKNKWKVIIFRAIPVYVAVFYLFNFVLWFISGMPNKFTSYFIHANPFGATALFTLFFPLARGLMVKTLLWRFIWLAVTLQGLLLIFVSTSRAIWLAGLVTLLTYKTWEFLSRSRFIFSLLPLLIYIFVGLWTLVYAYLPQTPYAKPLNAVMQEYTGKNLFSGRDRFWPDLLSLIYEKPLFGYGVGAQVEDYLNVTFSAHSLYLQTIFQMGLVGLVSLLWLLWCIWILFWKARETILVRLSASFFIGILIHQMLEVSLTQNILAVGVLQWLIISIGISGVLEQKAHT